MLMFVVHLVEVIVWFVGHMLFSLVSNISLTTTISTPTHVVSFLLHASIQHSRLLIIFLYPWMTL
ncbi:hypothetical protein HanPSC8_Chr08g0334621 [Helianthus annuus]|nr:hypothetical protein HanPSC8_Chr08g0334621 [Helianthus annuus]